MAQSLGRLNDASADTSRKNPAQTKRGNCGLPRTCSRPWSLFSTFLILAIVGVLNAASALAQNANRSIVGRVIDPNGAVIVGVEVQIENVGTSEVRIAKTNDSGDYTATLLNPGSYSLKFTLDFLGC